MGDMREFVHELYQKESRRVFATLVRLLGDFDLAEDATQEAFAAALEHWQHHGKPANLRAWLISTGRFKAIDHLRRQGRTDELRAGMAQRMENLSRFNAERAALDIEDDRLRLIFTCCHPALETPARIAMTLREVGGLTTEQVASAFLVVPKTIAQRIVRAKTKIREAGIPIEVPRAEEFHERLDSVLGVIYLIFNEGYSPSGGDALVRPDLSKEAIRLGRLVHQLLPDSEVKGLLALMLLHESRRSARVDARGDLILLEDQDRTRWDRELIREGLELVESAWSSSRIGAYTLQAAISAVHAEAEHSAKTDWARIVGLYDVLLRALPSPVVELNRAVAIALARSPREGLELVDRLLERGQLLDYQPIHLARADFLRRLGQKAEAKLSYERALELTKQDPQRRFLAKKIKEMEQSGF